MDFDFSDEQTLLRHSARAVARGALQARDVRTMWEDPAGYSEALWNEMAELGWLGLPFPEEHGGAGLGLVELASCSRRWAARPTRARLADRVLAGRPLGLGGTGARRDASCRPSRRARSA